MIDASAQPDVVVLSMVPFGTATRMRKVADVLSRTTDVTFLAPAISGRGGLSREESSTRGSLRIIHVSGVGRPRVGRPFFRWLNLVIFYLPALIKICLWLLRLHPPVILVGGLPLSISAFFPRILLRAFVVVDVNEILGADTDAGSSYGIVSRFDSLIVAIWGYLGALFVTVTPNIQKTIIERTKRECILVLNVPMAGEVPPYRSFPQELEDKTSIRLGFIGTLARGQALESCIGTVAELKRNCISTTLDIHGYGDATYVSELRRLIASLGLNGIVTIHDPIPRSAVLGRYQDFDIGLVTYDPRVGNDGLPNKLFDVVCAGRIFVATNGSAIRTFVEQSAIRGYLAEADSESLARAIVAAVEDRQHWDCFGRENHCFGNSYLSWESQFGEVLMRIRLRLST